MSLPFQLPHYIKNIFYLRNSQLLRLHTPIDIPVIPFSIFNTYRLLLFHSACHHPIILRRQSSPSQLRIRPSSPIKLEVTTLKFWSQWRARPSSTFRALGIIETRINTGLVRGQTCKMGCLKNRPFSISYPLYAEHLYPYIFDIFNRLFSIFLTIQLRSILCSFSLIKSRLKKLF